MKWTLPVTLAAALCLAPCVFAQETNTPAATTDAEKTNIRAYIELLRANVRTQKTAIMGEVMNLNDDQAAKFWPIYREYDAQLQELNDKKLEGIKDFAKNYDTMTNAKANELAKLTLALEAKRNELKAATYEKVNDKLGGVLAARFLQVENQLLMVIDLQIASSLPVVTSVPASK